MRLFFLLHVFAVYLLYQCMYHPTMLALYLRNDRLHGHGDADEFRLGIGDGQVIKTSDATGMGKPRVCFTEFVYWENIS